MTDQSSSFGLAIWRGTIFFFLVILFEIFWSSVIEPGGPLLTVGNIVLAGFASSAYVIIMHFIDQKRANRET